MKMDEVNTDAIRAFASNWSLAGDDKLLTILQNTHQKILSKSEEVNSKLEVMVAGLNDASISLQNVNNKFMALSNSQFIESRVYDDDEDITIDSKPIKEQPKQESVDSDISMLKRSLSVVESLHEMVTILRDSDTETDSDDEDLARVVMKPKDLYAHRPLPYIIGSQAWKNKWHAGLIVEDSESDSSTSKPDRDSEQYSDSEPEPDARPDGNIQTDTLNIPDQTMSETSSELASEQDTPTPAAPVVVNPSPADVAAELARRLAGQLPKVVEQDVPAEYVAPKPNRTVYRPHQPTPGTIFSDEPPPIEQDESSTSEEDDDIFAELHKKQPYKQTSTDNSRITDDLFDFTNKKDDIFSDFDTYKVPIPNVKPKSTLYEGEPDPELVAPKPETKPLKTNAPTESETGAIKKPVGGISLFGTNKGAESIGAAILKHNRRKSSSNDESESDDPIKPQTKPKSKPKVPTKSIEPAKPEIKTRQTIKEPVKKEKDIFDDLFAKSEKSQKNETVDKNKKVDLFSDNLFDDIDDIFTSNIVKTSSKTDKPIFEDDDLFADIAVTKIKNDKQKDKGLFDSDDDLFTEKPKTEPKISKVSEEIESKLDSVSEGKVKVTREFDDSKADSIRSHIKTTAIIPEQKHLNKSSKEVEVTKQAKSIFDDDSSDNDIFSSLKTPKPIPTKLPEKERPNVGIIDRVKLVRDKAKETSEDNNVVKVIKKTEVTKVIKETKSIFDDDSDSDIFANIKTTPNSNKEITQSKSNLEADKTNNINDSYTLKNESHIKATDKTGKLQFNSPSLFEDDEELFSKESIIVNNKVTIDEVKGESASNVLKTSHIVKETVITQETNNQADILNTKHEEPATVEIIDVVNDYIPKSNNTAIKNISDILKVIETVEEPPPFEIQTKSQLFDEELQSTTEQPDIFNDDKPASDPVNNKEDTLFAAETDKTNNINDSYTLKNKSHIKATDKIGKLPFNSPSLFDDDEELFSKTKESITVNNKVTTDEVKRDSASNVLKTSHIVKETVITQETNNQADILSTKHEEPATVEIIDVVNDSIPKYSDIPKVIETVEEQLFDEEIQSTTEQPDIFNDNKPASDPVNNKEDTLFAAEKDSVLIKPDIFSDIFTEPPAFEKLKEPKGSQNVNALFGDDSDDEALFFKKDDVISDDKPDIFVPNANTDMFGIFVDEPPAIDVDFVKKSDLNEKPFESDSNLFQSTVKPQEIVYNEDIIIPKSNETQKEKDKEPPKSIFEDSSFEIDKIDGAQAIDNENKKVGKLKTMNFKIDVNALLPGGSPKKKIVEQVDGQAVSISNEELPTNDEKVESKMVKSVSFEGKPDSEVLDNKLSKERAKIQVKRRPSTRRARREAVRKSVIDLDNDSTDNSSSIDDLPKSRKVLDKIEKKSQSNLDRTENNELKKAGDVKSKVVYILNDEDIFDTKAATIQTSAEESPILHIDNKSPKTDDCQSKNITEGISTIGNVYKEIPITITESSNSNVQSKKSQRVKAKSSLFGELCQDDDELFSKNKAIVKKTNIFESDSDDDLFTGKSKSKIKIETVERKREVVIKGSLFGDDDDDDLFGVKTKKTSDPIPQSSKSTAPREPAKSMAPVFDDPLSMLEDDD